ncbi:MAG: hypothetical protein AAGA08_04025 [Pseudomonadota bacterium]
MPDITLTKTRIQAGTYEGVLRANATEPPKIGAFLDHAPVGDLTVTPDPAQDGCWTVRLSIPAQVLTDGIQTFLITDTANDATLDSFTIITGEPLDNDTRGEIDLLRAELNMLKKAFRRHCVETS